MSDYDVIIIGAGYAGLAAGLALQKEGKKILLLEARNRCGGRILTEYFTADQYTDLGGQWIGPGHERMYALAKEFGIDTFHTHDTGKSSLLLNGKHKLYKGIIPPLPLFALLSVDRAIRKINKLAKTIDLEKPFASPHAAEWDSMSLADWMNQQMKNETARKMFAVSAEAVFATDASTLSFLHALFYIKSSGNLDYLMNIHKGAQQDRIKGGAQSICIKMAETLGSAIQYEKVVTQIIQDENGVRVSGDGFSFSTSHCIVAIPPVAATDLDFSPAVPEAQWNLMKASFMGSVVKCYAVYATPFWRKEFKNGLVAAPDEMTSVVFDNSPWDGSKGILMGFSLAEKAKHLMQHCYGGYTTNIALDDFLRDENFFAHTLYGEPLPAERGGPLRLVVPHLYAWKSAKWINGLEFLETMELGFWERNGYHHRGDPWAKERYSA